MATFFRSHAAKAVLASSMAVIGATAHAGGYFASTDVLGYTGTVTRYATLEDAQAQTNAISSTAAVPQRDLAFEMINGIAGEDDSSYATTAWYYTTNTEHDAYSGWGNPNNTNTGFFQLYDEFNTTITSNTGGWTDSNYDTFEFSITGANLDPYSRLWNAPSVGGPAGDTAGTFISYSINATIGGLAGAYDSGLGMYVSDGVDPTSVSGSITGIFLNDSTTLPSANGYYVFDLQMNTTSWAVANSSSLNGAIYSSRFGAEAVPEPTTMAVLGLGVFAMARRRNKA